MENAEMRSSMLMLVIHHVQQSVMSVGTSSLAVDAAPNGKLGQCQRWALLVWVAWGSEEGFDIRSPCSNQ